MHALAFIFADRTQLHRALGEAFKKLSPRVQWRNPVMFVVYVGSAFTTVLALQQASAYAWAITVFLWFTVLFANFAEALAEGRSKAQAASLRELKQDTPARRWQNPVDFAAPDFKNAVMQAQCDPHVWQGVNATQVHKGDILWVQANEVIAADGEVIYGAATVDESAITGESAPVIREAGGDFSAVTGGDACLVGLDRIAR